MTALLANWQVIGLGINADEEGKVRVAGCSERVPRGSEPSRTLYDSQSTRQDTTCCGNSLTLRSKNLCLVGAWNSHARRVANQSRAGSAAESPPRSCWACLVI